MTVLEIKRTPLKDIEVMMEAVRLREIDKTYHMHLGAWLGEVVKSKKKVGKNYKPYYKEFKDFFDYEKVLNEDKAKSEEPKENDFIKLILKANKGVNNG